MKTDKTETLELATTEGGAVVQTDAGPLTTGGFAALFKFAIENKSGLEIIERLSALMKEERRQRAKDSFDRALAAFQAECPIIKKTKGVTVDGSIRYRFAPLDLIISNVKGLLLKHGFSYTLDTQVKEKTVKAICTITHTEPPPDPERLGSHSQTSEFEVPIDSKARMSLAQQSASALTYATRYAFRNALGILTTDDDLDGRTEPEKPKGPSKLAAEPTVKELAAELWVVLKPVRGEAQNWEAANRYCWDESIIHDDEKLPHLTPERFPEVIKKAKAKLEGKK